MPAMLCFLPPVPPTPPQPPSAPRRPIGGPAAAALFTLSAVLALFTPVGWIRSQPVFELRAGVPTRFGPRAEDRDLVARLSRQNGRRLATTYSYHVSGGAYGSVPPGLTVEASTGALVGVPSLAGTYTFALGVSDNAAGAVEGSAFKVKVLPASAAAKSM